MSATTLLLGHGRHTLTWRPPHAGSWTVTLSATDLAGNHATATASVKILAPPPKHHKPAH